MIKGNLITSLAKRFITVGTFIVSILSGSASAAIIPILQVDKTLTLDPNTVMEALIFQGFDDFQAPGIGGEVFLQKSVFTANPVPPPIRPVVFQDVSHVLFGCLVICPAPQPGGNVDFKLYHFGFVRRIGFAGLFGFSDEFSDVFSFSETGTIDANLQAEGQTFEFNGQVPVDFIPIQEAFDMIPDIPEYQDFRNSIQVSEGGFVPVMMTPIPVPEKTSTTAIMTLVIVGTASTLKRKLKSSKSTEKNVEKLS